jgi:flagellar hook-length control protein FliK
MEDPKELSDLYKSIYEKTDKLMSAFQNNAGTAGEEMQNAGKSMQERIDFVQNLNELFGYAQIPVSISGNEANPELYVYMNKGKKLDMSKEVSALLHLDMDHLGATDVHVSLTGDMVHTRFYVEDEESARIIDEHMTMLEKAVNGAGYSLTNETVTRSQSINTTGNKVVDELVGKDLEQSIKRYSFDVKM